MVKYLAGIQEWSHDKFLVVGLVEKISGENDDKKNSDSLQNKKKRNDVMKRAEV